MLKKALHFNICKLSLLLKSMHSYCIYQIHFIWVLLNSSKAPKERQKLSQRQLLSFIVILSFSYSFLFFALAG